MKKTKMVQQEVEVLDDLICNKCGKSLKQTLTVDGEMFNFCGLEEVRMECGYGSENDGTVFVFSMCEECVLKLVDTFKIPVKKEGWGEVQIDVVGQ